jgi:hypothetical protein
MFVNRAPPRFGKFSSTARCCSKPCKVSIALFVDYSYYSSPIPGLFVLFVDYSRTIRTIRRLFVLFVDYSYYSHYSLHYSSFINYLFTYLNCSSQKPSSDRWTLTLDDLGLLHIPKTSCKTLGDRSFAHASPQLWNSLHLNVWNCDNISVFRKRLKTFLFSKAFN